MDTQLIYGRHPVMEAIKAGAQLEKVLLQHGMDGLFEKELRQLCREYKIPLQVVPKERISRESRGSHQGVIGIMPLIAYHLIADLLPKLLAQPTPPLLVVLDGITDVRNLGAIARSAECCGVQALITAQRNSAQINAEAIKASAGALTRLPVCREPSLTKAIELLQQHDVRLYVGRLGTDSPPLHQLDLRVPLAFVVGAEGAGVSPAVAIHADSLFHIPQTGQADSFNASVAAGIMLYEAMRQRSLAE